MTAAAPGRYDPWADALRAAALLAIDPDGLKGAIVRSLPGPARDAWLAALRAILRADAPMRRAPAHIDDERLLGGLDLAATLAAGRPVASRGLLRESDGGVVVLAMAERCTSATGARIAMALDAGEVSGRDDRHAACFMLIALEEGVEPDERAPDVLAERMAFALDLDGGRVSSTAMPTAAEIAAARVDLSRMKAADDRIIESICTAAGAFGVGSARAAMFTLRAARAAAALAGRGVVEDEDLALAARLVLAPRARFAPPDQAPESAPPPEESADDSTPADRAEATAAADRVVDAVQSALPAEFLAQFLEARSERRVEARSRGAGAAAKSARRGRPLGARPGTLRTGERLDLVATLRAAAPWQPLRRREVATSSAALVLVRRGDFRIRRFVQRLESTIIVVVDASGSAALQRLAEAKGAVETLLADAYVTRARVALIAFRDAGAEMLLPPTRSLSRAKRALAELPGGGTTPLATAIDTASLLAQSERAKGRTPLIVFLTDGRGNVGRDGVTGRAQAEADALVSARAVRAANLAAVFIDTSPRMRPGADALAAEMGAAYAPLPFVEAGAVASVVRAHAPARR
ncbi:magnesium chelatase subunit D [Terricaulis sp.]|uniref:magnesium chelatase subunit D n=1 Tax=Terricaulis sp. TaxID=2768686 RepID=UPI002AC45B48|nr:magnesium chelatase subunit D [Terricaulis sp.]MDZ4691536.1 magnesium chelatase subunit D [Terricaulis sp.]